MLPVHKIAQLHHMMVSVLSLVTRLCDHLLREDYWEKPVDAEEVGRIISPSTPVNNVCMYVLC